MTVRATDAHGNSGTVSLAWTVSSHSVFGIATTSLPNATPNSTYGPVTLQATGVATGASGHPTTLKWTKVSLPKGLKLSSAGVLSGTLNKKVPAGPTSAAVEVTETVTTINGKKKVKTPTTVQATIPLTVNAVAVTAVVPSGAGRRAPAGRPRVALGLSCPTARRCRSASTGRRSQTP